MRFIGLDVHRDFCEVAVFEDGHVKRHPRVPARPAALATFARSGANLTVVLVLLIASAAVAACSSCFPGSFQRCKAFRGRRWRLRLALVKRVF